MAATPDHIEAPPEASGNDGPLSNLTDRERKLVALMLFNFVALTIVASVFMFYNSLSSTRAEIEQYEQTLDALAEFGPKYLAQQAGGAGGGEQDAFSTQALAENDLQLTSFVATQASAVDLKIDNYDEDSLPIGSSNKDKGPILLEQQLRVDIREAELPKLLEMLDRIQKSPEPVVIKRINLRDVRGKKGHVRANITVSTYIQKEQES